MESAPDDLLPWVQDAVSSEHLVKSCTREMLGNASLGSDSEATLLVREVYDRSVTHVDRIEELLGKIDASPSVMRETIGTGLGATLGWIERLPNRDLVALVRDVYVVLNYAVAGYHVLYSRARLLGSSAAATLALDHLRDYMPAIRQLSHLLAWAAALDLPPEKWRASGEIERIVSDLYESWSSDVPLEREGSE